MVKRFDHVTIAVSDVDAAVRFFSLLGFVEDKRVVIKGEKFAKYMGVDGIEAEHVTLVLKDATPRTEVQILNYLAPAAQNDWLIKRLDKLGYNHVCFAVDDLEADVARLRAAGVQTRNDVMDFHSRKLVFLEGPEGVTVELSEWHD